MMNKKKKPYLKRCLSAFLAYLLLLPLRLLNLYLKDYSPSDLRAVTISGARYIWSFVILRETTLYLEMVKCIDSIVPTTVTQKILWIPLLRLTVIKKLLQMLQTRSLKRLQMRSINDRNVSFIYRVFPFLLKIRSKKLWHKAIHDNKKDLYRFVDPFRVNN